ncbi:MAG: CHAT domain-containing protein [Acidobacteriota bacterium]
MQENSRITAQRLTEEGKRLRAQGTPASLQKAAEKYTEAIALYRVIGDRAGEITLLLNIANVNDELGQREIALVHLNQALPLIRAAGDREIEAGVLIGIGKIYHSLEKGIEALSYYNQSLVISRALSDRYAEASALFHAGQVYFATRENLEAIASWNQSLTLFRVVGDKEGEALTLAELGTLHASLGEKQKALDYFIQSLPLLKVLGSRDREVAILKQIAEIHYSLGEKQKAIDCLEQALPLLRALGNRQAEADMLGGIGKIYVEMSEKQKALVYLNQALPLSQSAGDRRIEAYVLTNIGLTYSLLGEHQKALGHLSQALPFFRDLNDRSGEAHALNGMGKVYTETFESQKAFECLTQALSLYRAAGDRNGEALALINISQAHALLGETQKALDYATQARTLSQSLDNRSTEIYALNSLGFIYEAINERQKSLEYLNQALPLTRATGDRRVEAILLNGIGWLYDLMGDKQRALETYLRALHFSRLADERSAEAYTLVGIGWVYESLAEQENSLKYCNRALPLFRALGDRRGEGYALIGIGMAYGSLGDKKKALDNLDQALTCFRAVGELRGEEMTRYRIAHIERDSGNLTEAQNQIEAALKIVESLRIKVMNQGLRVSYRASMQDYYELYVDLLMQLHKRSPADGYAAMALQASERASARSLLESLTESRADIRQGIDTSLLARERSVQQQLNQKAGELFTGSPTETKIAAIKKEIDDLTVELQQVQTQIRQASPRYAALMQPQPLTAAEIQQQVLDADTLLLEYSLGNERSFLWAVTPTSISSFELPKREVIEAAAQRVYQLLFAPNRSIRGETVEQRSLRLGRTTRQFAEAAAQLSQMLLAPVAAQLGAKRLVIVADGALHYIPFGALPDPATNNHSMPDDLADKWKIILPASKPSSNLKSAEDSPARSFTPLIVNHEIINLPSASVLVVLRRELKDRKPAPKTLAVLADPVFMADDERVKGQSKLRVAKPDESLAGLVQQRILKQLAREKDELHIPRLPFTRQEAEQILALVPAGEGTLALDFEASRATVTSDKLSQYRIVHFATHGLADSERAELSTIVLSLFDEQGRPQDGFLRAHEVYNLNLPAELVVLSACETGLGKQVKGEGLVTLTRGFMYAGAARVVVSLWSVNDRATAELMTKFYRKMLVEGERPAAALRAAQIEMWKDKQWSAPYYWAAFTLQGEWR